MHILVFARLRLAKAAWHILVLVIALVGSASAGYAGKRVALIVGNDSYRHIPELRRAVTDASAVASALRGIGFKVLVAQNQDRQSMSHSLLAFDATIEKDDVAFFFFAGHGFEIQGRNYLLPTDVPRASEGEEELIKDASFPVDRIIERFQARGAQTSIIVLDACRNNPFARPGTRSMPGGGGLMPLTPPEGTFVLFSAGAKQTALDALGDSDGDPNSVFTRHFVRQLATPGLTLVQLAKRTQGEVKQVAASIRHQQTPAYYDEIIGDFVLNTKPGQPSEEMRTAVLQAPSPELLAPRPAPVPSEPVNAPLASFVRSGSGWNVSVSFIEPVTAIGWRIGDSGPFKETGFLDHLDPRTRRRLVNPNFELAADTPEAVIQIRAVDISGRTLGPFPISFHPVCELERNDRRMLEMTSTSWLAFREYNGILLYYTHLVSYRCAIREVRIGLDSMTPNRAVGLPACDPSRPYEIPENLLPYFKVPPATKMVSVELTYRDGSVSETKTFRR